MALKQNEKINKLKRVGNYWLKHEKEKNKEDSGETLPFMKLKKC